MRIKNARHRYSRSNAYLRRARAHYKNFAWMDWTNCRTITEKRVVFANAIRRMQESGLYSEYTIRSDVSSFLRRWFYYKDRTAGKVRPVGRYSGCLEEWHSWKKDNGFEFDARFAVARKRA